MSSKKLDRLSLNGRSAHLYNLNKSPSQLKKSIPNPKEDTEKTPKPDTLDLSNKHLKVIPLVQETNAYLNILYFSNNYIEKIANLEHFQNLIYLDLYNNKIKDIQNLDKLLSLRVLLLGRNQISKIENLSTLHRLDVLDLRSNSIVKIENLSLEELRTLNLSNNSITVVENLQNLPSLTEIDLRDNKIEMVKGSDNLPSLQRVCLRNNNLRTYDDIAPVLHNWKSITDLELTMNPITNEKYYQQHIIESMPTLISLDNNKISASDVISVQELTNSLRTKLDLSGIESPKKMNILELSSASKSSTPTKRGHTEISNGRIIIHENAKLPSFDKWNNASIFGLVFKNSSIENIISQLSQLPTPNTLRSIVCTGNSINSLSELNSVLSHFPSKIHDIQIIENEIVHSTLFRSFVIFKMKNVVYLNQIIVGNDEKIDSFGTFSNVEYLTSIYPTFQPNEKDIETASKYIKSVDDQAKDLAIKLDKFEAIWPSLLYNLVQETINEIT